MYNVNGSLNGLTYPARGIEITKLASEALIWTQMQLTAAKPYWDNADGRVSPK